MPPGWHRQQGTRGRGQSGSSGREAEEKIEKAERRVEVVIDKPHGELHRATDKAKEALH